MNFLSKFPLKWPSDLVNEQTIKYSVFAIVAIEYLWHSYLIFRQHKKTKATTELPSNLSQLISQETFEKGRLYVLARLKFLFVKNTFQFALTEVIIQYQCFLKLWNVSLAAIDQKDELYTTCIWVFLYTTFLHTTNLPFNIYKNYVIKRRYGFGYKNTLHFLLQQTHDFLFSQVIYVTSAALIVVVVRNGGKNFFAHLWLALSALGWLVYVLYPSIVVPVFHRYNALPDGDLVQRIRELAEKVHFPLGRVFSVPAARGLGISHSHLFYYGLFRSKSLVLHETLWEEDEDSPACSDDEIVGLFSHELGHWHNNHVCKILMHLELHLLAALFIISWLFDKTTPFTPFGFVQTAVSKCMKNRCRSKCKAIVSKPIPIFMRIYITWQFLMMPYNAIMDFYMKRVVRRSEFQADLYAKRLGKSESLVSALIKLHRRDVQFPVYDKWYSAWYHYRPPILERIEEIHKSD